MTSKVKARDLRCGTVVLWRGYYDGARKPPEVAVAKVERLGDLVGPLQERIAKAGSRQTMRKAAEGLVDVIDALDMYGREGRRITLNDVGGERVVDIESGREFEWRGQRP